MQQSVFGEANMAPMVNAISAATANFQLDAGRVADLLHHAAAARSVFIGREDVSEDGLRGGRGCEQKRDGYEYFAWLKDMSGACFCCAKMKLPGKMASEMIVIASFPEL